MIKIILLDSNRSPTKKSPLACLQHQNGFPIYQNAGVIFFLFQVCKNDTACMRDLSLTGNVSIADAYISLQSEIEAANITNKVFVEAEKTFLKNMFG